MLILSPISKETIWGTPRMGNYAADEELDKVGSVYTVAAIPTLSNPIDHPDFEEDNFYDAFRNHPEKFGFEKDADEYPLLISFTGADDNLSIQVHPTDEFAQQNENRDYGKSESWYFIDTPDENWIYAGSLETNKETIRKELEKGNIDSIVNKLEVKNDELVFVPSGTLHALTRGSLVYEIQQSTDITYRFFDYNRTDSEGNKRELHVDKAISTLDPKKKVNKKTFPVDSVAEEEPYTLEIKFLEEIYKNNQGFAQVISVIKDKIVINDHEVKQGCSLIVFPNEEVNISNNKGKVIIATPKI